MAFGHHCVVRPAEDGYQAVYICGVRTPVVSTEDEARQRGDEHCAVAEPRQAQPQTNWAAA